MIFSPSRGVTLGCILKEIIPRTVVIIYIQVIINHSHFADSLIYLCSHNIPPTNRHSRSCRRITTRQHPKWYPSFCPIRRRAPLATTIYHIPMSSIPRKRSHCVLIGCHTELRIRGNNGFDPSNNVILPVHHQQSLSQPVQSGDNVYRLESNFS